MNCTQKSTQKTGVYKTWVIRRDLYTKYILYKVYTTFVHKNPIYTQICVQFLDKNPWGGGNNDIKLSTIIDELIS